MPSCKNCNNEFEGRFCNQCGQKVSTDKFDFKYLIHELQHDLLHLDRGILYTIKQLFTRPGDAIREFIEGKRISYTKPFALVIMLSTIYAILYHYLHLNFIEEAMKNGMISVGGDANEVQKIQESTLNPAKIGEWITSHYAITTILMIPFLALGSFIAFKKRGFNFVEHIILNTYATAQATFVHIGFIPFLYFFKLTQYLKLGNNLMILMQFVLLCWVYLSFFKGYSKMKDIFLTVIGFLIYSISVGIMSGVISIVYVLLSHK